MASSLPFHSVKRGAPQVFHNNGGCDGGLRIEPVNWRAGDGGRPLCAECVRRNTADQLIRERHSIQARMRHSS